MKIQTEHELTEADVDWIVYALNDYGLYVVEHNVIEAVQKQLASDPDFEGDPDDLYVSNKEIYAAIKATR